uniref:Uncharacterized protein n=1 Tax=Ditylenchus dipsaci TaxID=166011 RepID=A0A915EES0_9BILA
MSSKDTQLKYLNLFGRHVKGVLGAVFPVLLLVTILSSASALTCFETENDKTIIRHNDTWLFCSLVPATLHRHEHTNGTQFGVGPLNDGMEAYKAAFKMNDQQYKVLTVCILERLDFSQAMGFKPNTSVEFVFRCVCNYDLCNSEPTFHPYLKD